MFSYVPNHSKHSKTTKVIKFAMNWIDLTLKTSNNAKLQKLSKYDELHRFDVKTIKKCWVTSQTIPNTAKKQSDQITMNCIDLTLERSKMFSYVPNHSKHSKTTKVIKLRGSAWIWRQNEQKCWVTSQTIQNNANLKKVITIQWIASIWCQNDKNVELRPKPFQTQQNYKSNQITMNCIDLMSKTSNNAKLQKLSKYDELHRFDVKTIKKCWVTSQTIPNTVKLQKWSNYEEVHGFDVKTNKNVELRRKPFKTTQI